MNKFVIAIIFAVIFFKPVCNGQIIYPTSITPAGSPVSCDTVVLSCTTFSNTWNQKANFSGGTKSEAISFSIGSKGYLGTGYNGSYSNSLWEYDPATDAWTQKADFGSVARSNSIGFSIGNKGYVGTGGGATTPNYNDFWEYDPATNVWTIKTYFLGGVRVNATAFSIGNKGYIGTGMAYINNVLIYYNDFWEYDPVTDTWTQKANVGGSVRFNASSFSLGGKGYIGLGNDSFTTLNDFWEYDQATNTWIQKANFAGGARESAVGLSIDCKGYMGLGYNGSYKNDFWEYNPTTNTWASMAAFTGGARKKAAAFSIGNKGYVGTGFDGTYKNDFWEYSPPVSYAWSNGATTQSIVAHTSGNYSVVVTSPTCGSSSATKSVTINVKPTISVNSTTMCLGSNAVLTATANPNTGVTYSWSPNTSSSASATVSPTTNTVYTVTAINGGCNASATSTVQVYSTSTATTGFSYATPVCINSSNPSPTTVPGFISGGIYSSSPGLTINSSNGIINLSSSTAGTYAVTYSLTGNSCLLSGSSTANIVITNTTTANTSFSYASPVCSSQLSSSPNLVSGFSNGGVYSNTSGLIVNSSTGIIDLENSPAGTYTVDYSYSSANCVIGGSGAASITIVGSPTISAGSSVNIVLGASATLTVSSSPGTYTWSPSADLSCATCSNIVVTPTQSTEYCVTTTDGTCPNSVCMLVNIEMPCDANYELALPNAFSPNGDGNNDKYCLQGWDYCVTNFSIIIYNRWGEKVFESIDPSFCWDGTQNGKTLEPAVFVYIVKALYNNNESLSKKGNVTLIK